MSDLTQHRRYVPTVQWHALPAALAGRELAGYGDRVRAALIDTLFVLTVVGVFVNLWLMGRYGPRNGMTLGKQVVGIRVIREDRERMTIGFAVLRDVLVRGLLLAAAVVDLAWPLFDHRRQALHDKLARTFVVRASSSRRAA